MAVSHRLRQAINAAQLSHKPNYQPGEVARLLTCHPSTIYRMIEDGQLEAIRIRRNFRVPVWALEKLFNYLSNE